MDLIDDCPWNAGTPFLVADVILQSCVIHVNLFVRHLLVLITFS